MTPDTPVDLSAGLDDARLVEVSLRGARLTDCDLTGVVMRSVEVVDVDIDAPWLLEGGGFLRVNGVDVVPLVKAELERRFPGRELMEAADPDGLRAAWAELEAAWDAVLARVASMPAGTVDISVDGEWSVAQTLRHLVLATDVWLRRAVLGIEPPFHPLGLADAGAGDAGLDLSVFVTEQPTYADVLAARADRVGQVRDFIGAVDAGELAHTRTNPWRPSAPETTLSCLHTILHEEWEHLRFAVRDLDVIASGA